MTPKEKAWDLVLNFRDVDQPNGMDSISESAAIECAIIAVKEVLKVIRYHGQDIGEDYSLMEWTQIKKELENL